VDQASLFSDLREGITQLRERNYIPMLKNLEGLEHHQGWARLVDGTTVEVNGKRISGDAILIATGSRTDLSPASALPEDRVLSNENFFYKKSLPPSVLVIGGGYIAVELAQMMNRFGVAVTTLQRSEHVLSAQPAYVGEELGEVFRNEGMNLMCGVDLKELREGGCGVEAVTVVDGEERIFSAESVLMARGRLGNTEKLGVEAVGIQPGRNGFLEVNEHYQTSCPTVYAVGDVLGGHMLVYTASSEAERMVAGLFGEEREPILPESVPWVVFTHPQAAGVGWSLEEATEQGYTAEEAELPVSRWPRFSTINETRGFLKLVRDTKTDTLLGARAVCPEAGDLMSELALIRDYRIPLKQIGDRVVPYLTLNEGIQRCAAKFHH
jgi:mercuric reductase